MLNIEKKTENNLTKSKYIYEQLIPINLYLITNKIFLLYFYNCNFFGKA